MNPQPVSLADELRGLVKRLDEQAQEWDEKNNDSPMPTNAKSPDYVYGYNSGVSQGFTSAAAKLSALLEQHAVAEPTRKWICTCAEGKDGRPIMDKDCMVHAPDPAGAYATPAHAAEQPKLTEADDDKP